MSPVAASSEDDLAWRFLAQPGTPDARVKLCLEAIRRALEEHDCELQVSIHFTGAAVSPEVRVIPEASANKYMLWVRFTVQDGDLRPRAVDVDVPFQLTLCSL